MARFTITTRDIGRIEFTCPDDGGYVYADLNGQPGTLGRQICAGGGTMGSTLRATRSSLADVARKWNSQRRRANLAIGR